MDLNNEKCVMIIDGTLPLRVVVNLSAILGITLGKNMPEVVGSDVTDKSGLPHAGITEFPVPILRGSTDEIKKTAKSCTSLTFQIYLQLIFQPWLRNAVHMVSSLKKYVRRIAELEYLGIAVCGGRKKVNKLTGSMPLLM